MIQPQEHEQQTNGFVRETKVPTNVLRKMPAAFLTIDGTTAAPQTGAARTPLRNQGILFMMKGTPSNPSVAQLVE